MGFAVIKDEKINVSDLPRLFFEIKGRGAAEAARKVEAALRRVNPHIRDLPEVHPGTLIVLPDLPDGPPLKSTQTAGVGPELGDQAKIALKELGDAINRSAATEEQSVSATNDLLKSPEVKAFAGQLPEVKEQLANITEAAKKQVDESKRTATAQKEALAQLQEALGKFKF